MHRITRKAAALHSAVIETLHSLFQTQPQSNVCEPLESRLLFNAGGGFVSYVPASGPNAGVTGDGIYGAYFNNGSMTGTASFTRFDARVDFPAGTTEAPGGGLSTDPAYGAITPASTWSVLWEGTVVPKYTEVYTLKEMIGSGDTGTVYFGTTPTMTTSTQILSGSGTQSTTVTMTAGVDYDLEMTYVHNGGSTWQAQLHWSSSGAHSFAEEAIEPATTIGGDITNNEPNDTGGLADTVLGAPYTSTSGSAPTYLPSNYLISGSTTISNVDGISYAAVGQWIEASGIPSGTTIAAVNTTTDSITLSSMATETTETTLVVNAPPPLDSNGQPTGDFVASFIAGHNAEIGVSTISFNGAAALSDQPLAPVHVTGFLLGINNGLGSATGSLTTGSNVITGAFSDGDFVVGETITGTGIPAGDTITALNSDSSITLAATVTTTAHETVTAFLLINGQDYYSYGNSLPLADQTYSTTTGTGYNPANNTTEALWDDQGGEANIYFQQTSRNGYGAPGNTATASTGAGITNLSAMAPTSLNGTTDYPVGTVFNTAFLQMFASYTTIRQYQSWSADQADSDTETDWANRTTPSPWDFVANANLEYDGPYTTNEGIPPLEQDILICNETGKDFYISVPPSVSGISPTDTNSYVYQLAELLKNGDTVDGVHYPGLLPNLNIYIEYTDELWNTSLGFDLAPHDAGGDFNEALTTNNADYQSYLAAGGWSYVDDPINLASDYNNAGIYNQASTFSSTGGLDGSGDALITEPTDTASLGGANPLMDYVAGSSIATAGPGDPSGSTADNVVSALGQTIALAPEVSQDLFIYGMGIGNQASQGFTITYTNGTTQTYSESIGGWTTSGNPSVYTTVGSYATSSGSVVNTSNYIYQYELPLSSTLTVKSITLPNNPDVKVLSMMLQYYTTAQNAPGYAIEFNDQLWDVTRMKDISGIFRGVYGNSAMPSSTNGSPNADPRVRPLYEWQSGGDYNGGLDSSYLALSQIQNASGLDANYFLYGGGGAWYNTDSDTSATVADLYADLPTLENLPNNIDYAPDNSGGLNNSDSLLSDVQICQEFGLKDVGYEGGFDFGGNFAVSIDSTASSSPSVTPYVTAAVDQFFQAGGSLPIVFGVMNDWYPTSQGYGVLTSASNTTNGIYNQAQYGVPTPKLQGYLNAEAALPPTPLPTGWTATAIGGNVYSGQFTGTLTSGSTTITGVPNTASLTTSIIAGEPISGNFIPAGATIAAVGTTSITLSTAATSSGSGVLLTVNVANVNEGIASANEGGSGTWTIDSQNPKGTAFYSNGHTSDQYYQVSTTVSGNVVLTAELTDASTEFSGTNVGLVMRETTAANSPVVALSGEINTNGFMMGYRTSTSSAMTAAQFSDTNLAVPNLYNFTGNVTSGSTTMTSVTGLAHEYVGEQLSGSSLYFPPGTAIVTWSTAGGTTSVILSNAATGTGNNESLMATAPPVWMEIIESGDVFTGYIAPNVNGQPGTWTEVGAVTLTSANFPTTSFLAGIFQDSNQSADFNIPVSTFQNVSVTQPVQIVSGGSETLPSTTSFPTSTLGSNGYLLYQTNSLAATSHTGTTVGSVPSYVTGTVSLNTSVLNGAYAGTSSPAYSEIDVSGTPYYTGVYYNTTAGTPGNAVTCATFTLSTTTGIPEEFQLGILSNNSNNVANNPATITVSDNGVTATPITVTTATASNNFYLFDITGALPGDTISVIETYNSTSSVRVSVAGLTFDTPGTAPTVTANGYQALPSTTSFPTSTLGSNGYLLYQTNSLTATSHTGTTVGSVPSYVTGTVSLNTSVLNGAYAGTSSPAYSEIDVSGTPYYTGVYYNTTAGTPGNAVTCATFTLSTTTGIPEEFQLGILSNNSNNVANNPATITVSDNGVTATPITVTTATASNNFYLFDITGALPGDTISVIETYNSTSSVRVSVAGLTFDTPVGAP